MKKLMTSLLAVLLCGIGFLWADGVTVSGLVKYSTNPAISWEYNSSVTLETSDGTKTTQDLTRGDYHQDDGSYDWTFKFENVTDNTYTLSFKGYADSYIYTASQSVTVSGSNVTDIMLNAAYTAINMTVKVMEKTTDYYNKPTIEGAQVTYKEKDASGEGTTVTTNSGGRVSFEAEPNKHYTITVTATGYKTVTLEDVVATTSKDIEMEVIPVTLSGTLKVGATTLASLPEGMALVITVGGTKYTPEIGENGYSMECKAGAANIYITDQLNTNFDYYVSEINANRAADYKVITPENGSFTVTAGTDNTATQNIVLEKTAAAVFGTTSVWVGDNGLTLTSQGESETTYTAKYLANSNNFRFNSVAAGTYTLGCKQTGYQLKGEAPTVTVTGTTDVNLGAVEIEAVEAEYTFTGTVDFRGNAIVGATLKLYPLGQTAGEALASATTNEQGEYTLKTNARMGDQFTLTLSHATLITTETTVTVIGETNQVGGSGSTSAGQNPDIMWLWASGKVNYEGEDIDTGNFQILLPRGSSVENVLGYAGASKVLFNSETGDFSLGSTQQPSSTCTITFVGREKGTRFFLTDTAKDVDFSNGAVTDQTLTLQKDANRGYMRVGVKYQTSESVINSVRGVTVYGYLPGDTYTASMHPTTDNYGYAYFLVNKDTKFDSLKPLIYGDVAMLYKAGETMKNVDGFFTDGQGDFRPNDLVINLEGAEPTARVTISGNITTLPGLGDDVKIGLQTQRDLQVITADIVNGQYTFENVPVFTQAASNYYLPAVPAVLPIFLMETDAKYYSVYGVSVPFNYEVTPKTVTVEHGASSATLNLTVVKIACNVSGSVSPAKTGEATLTKQGDEEPTYKANIVGAGTYTFQGVLAGTYTLNVNCAGYSPATRDVTVEATLADVTVPAITLESAPLTVEVGGVLTASRNGKTYYFEGAELAIYDGDEKLAESTVPEGSMGTFSFTFTSTIGTTVRFTMKHPSIKDVSKEYKVTGDKLTINASDLNYEFIESGNDDYVVMTGFKAEWNADISGLNLSWTWPEGADGKIKKITLRRKLSGETGNGVELTTWEATGDNPHDNTFAADELPVAYADTVTVSTSYAYLFEILYADLHRESVWFTADMRDGDRYKLTYTVNDDKMGTISSYMQPEGEYQENDPITVTATAKPGYKFVEFLKNDQKLTEAELGRITLLGSDRDSVAIFGFNMPAEDLTVKAVFAAKGQAPDVTVEYTVTLVSSNEAWGTVSGGGKFKEGTEIEVKATVTDAAKYKFVAWKEGDKEVSKDATYKFKVEKDITLTAVFEEVTANENLKAARWTIFAEDGAIVIKGINGDRYDIYDLNGRLSGSALCTGAEIRLGVAKSKLYIVRRLGADGSFDAKKIVVR